VTLLVDATLLGGGRADVRLDGGLIAAVEPAGGIDPVAGEDRIDLAGTLLLPAPAEPHAHLDKALTADRVPNPAGDLTGAIRAWYAHRPSLSVADITARARAAALGGLGRGTTAIRTHVDVGEGIELRAVEALIAVRDELAGLVDIQIVALVSHPLTGLAGERNRSLLRDALDAGADLVGGAPHIDPDPRASLEICLTIAADFGCPVDLHTDETLDPGVLGLADLASMGHDFPHALTASHCVSLGVQPAPVQAQVAAAVAAAGIAVVTLPQTNLYLQARGCATGPARGLTAVRALLDAGVTLAAGGDNVQDPFNPLGRGDPLEAAALLVAAGHTTPLEAWVAVSAAARQAMGLPAVSVSPGAPADLVAVEAGSIGEALALAPEARLVFKAGRLVARTTVARTIAEPGGSVDLAMAV
jgi:cytosine deaminase